MVLSACRDMASITRLLPFHNSPFSFIITIFVLLSCFQWFAFKNGWHYLENDRETTLWSARGNLSRLRAAKSPSNRCICCTSTSLLHVSCLLLMFTAQFIYDRIQLLEITGLLSFLHVTECHMLTVPCGENLKRRLVSIAV